MQSLRIQLGVLLHDSGLEVLPSKFKVSQMEHTTE